MSKNVNIDLNDFVLPIKIINDNEYFEKLTDILSKYCDYIDEFVGLRDDCKKTVRRNSEKILKCVEQYYNANVIEAQRNITRLLENYKSSKFIVNRLDRNYAFRGIAGNELRYSDNCANKEIYKEMLESEFYYFRARSTHYPLKKIDMLHIPFEKRGLVATQRYSVAGVPCFYFASTSLGAWIEMGMPESTKFNVSAYRLPGDLQILNLCQSNAFIQGSSSLLSTDEEFENLYHFMEIFPLVIATSFYVAETNRNFKSEYIVSQLVMQSVKELGLDGVAYFSKKTDDIYAYPCAVNLAILMPSNVKEKTGYWERIGEIALTEPVRFSDFLSPLNLTNPLKKEQCISYVNKIYFNDAQTIVEICGNKFKYCESSFAKYDEFIVREEFKKYKGNDSWI